MYDTNTQESMFPQEVMQALQPTTDVNQPVEQAPMQESLFPDEVSQALSADTDEPSNVSEARSLVGNTDYNGWCQSFAEDVTKSGWKGSSAIEAYNNYQKEGKSINDLNRARPGDLIYFNPDVSNNGYGHVGILTGDGKFISATDNGVQEMPLSDWEKLTGQQVAGIVPLSAIRQSN